MSRKIGTFLSFILVTIEIVSAIFLTPFLIRQFGKSEYGVYTLVLSITSYLTLLDLGIGNSVVKFVASYRANGEKSNLAKFEGIINTFYFLIGIVTIIIGAIIILIFPYAFSNGLSEEEIKLSQKLLFLTTINVAITLSTSGMFYSIVGYEKFIISKGVPSLFTLIRVALSFAVLGVGGKSIEIAFLQLIITVLTRITITIYGIFFLKIPFSLKRIERKQIKLVLSFSIFVFLQMIATQINSMVDNILIGMIVTDASIILAIYGVGATLKSYLATFGGVINGVLMPGVVKLVEGGANSMQIENEMVRIGRIVFAFTGAIFFGFCVFGDQFINLWAGEGYSNSFYVAIVLMSVYVITLTQSIGSQFLWAKNEHKEISIIKLVIVFLNVAFTILLIHWDPLYGAVIGTFISIFLGDVVLSNIVFKKKLGVNLLSYWLGILKGVFPSLLIATCLSILFKLTKIDGWIGFVLNGLFFVTVYVFCLFLFGFNKSEKKYIEKLVHRK